MGRPWVLALVAVVARARETELESRTSRRLLGRTGAPRRREGVDARSTQPAAGDFASWLGSLSPARRALVLANGTREVGCPGATRWVSAPSSDVSKPLVGFGKQPVELRSWLSVHYADFAKIYRERPFFNFAGVQINHARACAQMNVFCRSHFGYTVGASFNRARSDPQAADCDRVRGKRRNDDVFVKPRPAERKNCLLRPAQEYASRQGALAPPGRDLLCR